ncbi:MAG TPA: RNA polymerase sigma factor [Ktedonosporobacter sp.]|nr:RNA polymerase sigma factor [Ktedonosporobacter sp.]
MFYSLAIPGILQATPGNAALMGPYWNEKVPASMTVDKPADRRGANASSDEATLTRLYEQFKRPIHSYTYRLLGNQEDADDVTQEVFVRACTSWNGLYEREHLSAWLYRIATNLCVDVLRRRKRISWWPLSPRNRSDEYSDDMTNDTMAYFLSDSGGIPEIAERDLIRLTLSNMPEEYAIVLVLSAAQGVGYQEIADIVGVTPNAAATRISRAKKMFAERYQRLSKDGVGKQEKRK